MSAHVRNIHTHDIATRTGCVKLKRARTYCVGFSVYMEKLLGSFIVILRLNIGCIPGRQTAQAGLEFTKFFLGQTVEYKVSVKLCTTYGWLKGTRPHTVSTNFAACRLKSRRW